MRDGADGVDARLSRLLNRLGLALCRCDCEGCAFLRRHGRLSLKLADETAALALVAPLGVLVEARGGVGLRRAAPLLLRGFLLGEPGCVDLRAYLVQRVELLVPGVVRAFNAGCRLAYALRR